MTILIAILGLAFLMVVHETGHFLVARYFGMRVIRFSIGFGPAIFKRKPKGSDTTYQLAIIPFLAYVQIAGMNPMEDSDPNDKGSYANASVTGRILTIFAGPLANYLVASILFFISFITIGTPELTDKIKVFPNSAASESGMLTGDKILGVEGVTIKDFEHLRSIVGARAEQKTEILVQRADKQLTILVTPKKDPAEGKGRIGVQQLLQQTPVSPKKAAILSLKAPPRVVAMLVEGLGRMASCKEKPDLSGPVGIVKETAKAAEEGMGAYFLILGSLSAYLAGFNLIPFPALDGGRLLFLAYEAASRRKPNAKIEAYIHFAGLVLLLGLVAVVTILKDVRPSP